MFVLGSLFSSVSEAVERMNTAVNGVVWGPPMLALILFTGVFFTFRTGFFQISTFWHVLEHTVFAVFKKKSVTRSDDHSAISQFQAVTTALAATIGTGNIVGVATAICLGGPGAVFWMWFSAFFGMMTNFAENVLGIYFRTRNANGEWSGGPMYYISNGLADRPVLRHIARPLAVLFSLFCVFASFGIGNLAQINTISETFKSTFGIPSCASGISLMILSGLIILGGIKRIAAVAEHVVPFMAFLYIAACCFVILKFRSEIPGIMAEIIKSAMGFNAVAGGISGSAVRSAMTMGVKRCIFSNEAGLGSSVMVHSSSNVKEPAVQGIWGIFAVFFDTIIVCSLTAFVVLVTGVHKLPDVNGAAMVSRAFAEIFHTRVGEFLSLAQFLFAFTTMLGWSFYGSKAVEYLFGLRAVKWYRIVFVIFVPVSAVTSLRLAWDISDTLNGLMAIPNIIALLLLSPIVIDVTRNYVVRRVWKNGDLKPMLSATPQIQSENEAALAVEYSNQDN